MTAQLTDHASPLVETSRQLRRVLVACPDARPPAYEATAGLGRAGLLDTFATGYYFKGHSAAHELARQYFPCQYGKVRRRLKRRTHRGIPADRVVTAPSFDVALAAENRLALRFPTGKDSLARWRTRRFDAFTARTLDRTRPDLFLAFSDVASKRGLPLARRLGIPTILSMVHGEVNEEREILAREAEESPDFFPIYLGDGKLDLDALEFLHERRGHDLANSDLVLVPSEHIADRLVGQGRPRESIRVIPYAADVRHFRPDPDRTHGSNCTFLFAGGITQRKGIKYLLEAWKRIKRPGWRLQLLGGLPAFTDPLEPYRDDFEHLGRVGHAEMPSRMAAADVFVFPSLFEGSAVVTYEALACGLPSLVTPNAGSVVRDGLDGYQVEARDVESLAERMEQLGCDPDLRAEMAANARRRAEEFDWARYQGSVIHALRDAHSAGFRM